MRRHSLLALALLTAACESVSAPGRKQAYPVDDLRNPGLIFHWTPDRLPVRYWVSRDAGVVRTFVQEGIATWAYQFLYGQFRGILVSDSTQADVIVHVAPSTPPAGEPTSDPPIVGACGGKTDFDLEDNEDRLTGPFRITISWDPSYPDVDVVNCLERVTVHEIGHTIGLLGHSPDEEDLMAPNPRVRAPSTADRQTAEVLYGLTPSIHPARTPE